MAYFLAMFMAPESQAASPVPPPALGPGEMLVGVFAEGEGTDPAQARARALADARSQAESVAERLGLGVGRIARVSTRRRSGALAALFGMAPGSLGYRMAGIRSPSATNLVVDYILVPR